MKRKYKKNKTNRNNRLYKTRKYKNKTRKYKNKTRKYKKSLFRIKNKLIKLTRKYKKPIKLYKKNKKSIKKYLGKKIFKGGTSMIEQVVPMEVPNSMRSLVGGVKNSINMLQGKPINVSNYSSPLKGQYGN